METQNETKPLLTKDLLPTKYSEVAPSNGINSSKVSLSKTKSLIGEKYLEAPPPPYETAIRIVSDSANQSHSITCRVCQNQVDINGKQEQFVVKCSYCGESTPIRAAPAGKKYVRCPCNCLLICKISSQRIACPRPNCKRTINLIINSPVSFRPTQPGLCHISCRHCEDTFLFDTLQNALATCPHCRKVSSVGNHFARGRGTFFFFVGGLMFIIALVFIFSTKDSLHFFLIVLYVVLFLIAFLAWCRSFYYFTMKVSEIEELS